MRSFFVYILPTFVGATLLLYYMKPLTHWVGNFIHPRVDANRIVGEAQEVVGSVIIKRYKENQFTVLRPNSPVYNYDRIQVPEKASLTLNFPSGYSIKFLENSEFVLELWDYQKPKLPTYIYLNRGRHEMLKRGPLESLYILKDNQQFTPDQTIPTYIASLEVLPTSASPPRLPAKQKSLPKSPHPPLNLQKLKKDLNNLSNKYINKVVGQQRLLFEDCLANALRDNKKPSGDILVGFSILPSGKTENIKAISDQLNNPTLKNCVLNVFKRTKFQSFQGKAIAFSFPLKFK